MTEELDKIVNIQQQNYNRINDQIIIKEQGQGGTSKVKLTLDSKTGQISATKIMKLKDKNPNSGEQLLKENEALLKLDHFNIIKLYEISNNGTYIKKNGTVKFGVPFARLELITNGEMYDYIDQTGPLSEEIARFYFWQLYCAIKHCHDKGFAHRDLKLENILLDDNFIQKLVDFGFAKYMGSSNSKKQTSLRTLLGTQTYMAPEILRGNAYGGNKVDIFSLGVVQFILVTGTLPFSSATNIDRLYKLFHMQKYKEYWMILRKSHGIRVSKSLMQLITKMFLPNPDSRISLEEIANHEWVNGKTASYLEVYNNFKMRKTLINTRKEHHTLRDKHMVEGIKKNLNFDQKITEKKPPITKFESKPDDEYKESKPISKNENIINDSELIENLITPEEISKVDVWKQDKTSEEFPNEICEDNSGDHQYLCRMRKSLISSTENIEKVIFQSDSWKEIGGEISEHNSTFPSLEKQVQIDHTCRYSESADKISYLNITDKKLFQLYAFFVKMSSSYSNINYEKLRIKFVVTSEGQADILGIKLRFFRIDEKTNSAEFIKIDGNLIYYSDFITKLKKSVHVAINSESFKKY